MEHLIAKGIDRVLQLRHTRRIRRWKATRTPFVTGAHLRRFSILASIITGAETRVVTISGDAPPRPYLPHLHKLGHTALMAEHGFPWTDGETIFLPLSFIDMADLSLQEDLAKVTLFFLSYQIKANSMAPSRDMGALLQRDQVLADIYWIVENGRIFSSIQRDFPKVLRNYAAIQTTLFASRPRVESLTKGEAVVERLFRTRAGGALDTENLISPAGSLSLAMEIRERLKDDVSRSRKYRGMVPFTPWGKFMPGRIPNGSPRRQMIYRGEAPKGMTGAKGPGQKKMERPKDFPHGRYKLTRMRTIRGLL